MLQKPKSGYSFIALVAIGAAIYLAWILGVFR